MEDILRLCRTTTSTKVTQYMSQHIVIYIFLSQLLNETQYQNRPPLPSSLWVVDLYVTLGREGIGNVNRLEIRIAQKTSMETPAKLLCNSPNKKRPEKTRRTKQFKPARRLEAHRTFHPLPERTSSSTRDEVPRPFLAETSAPPPRTSAAPPVVTGAPPTCMATGRMRFVAPPVAWTLTAASAGLKPSSFRSTEESEETGERAP